MSQPALSALRAMLSRLAFVGTALCALVACRDDAPRQSCANETCTCEEGRDCNIACDAPPCHVVCEQGSSCIVHGPNAQAGTQDCDITRCESGQVTLCPDGKTTTCNASCSMGSERSEG